MCKDLHERGLFDMVFFADLNYISDTFKGSLEPALRYAAQAPEHDPVVLLGWLAAVTKHIGLGATFSTSNQHPFYAARMWGHAGSPDQRPGGLERRDVDQPEQQANYGTERADADTRYDQAHEYMEVCQLWDSWDEDAVVMDKEGAVFADASKVRRIEHEGHFFKSRGPLNVRSPQERPRDPTGGRRRRGHGFRGKIHRQHCGDQPRAENAAEYFAESKSRMEKIGRNRITAIPYLERNRSSAKVKRVRSNCKKSITNWCRSMPV